MRWFYLFTVLFLASCGPTPHFSELVELDNTKWTTDELVVFSPVIEDLESAYDLHLIIDHNQSYSYENIYFKIITKFPDQNSQEELLSVDLPITKDNGWAIALVMIVSAKSTCLRILDFLHLAPTILK